VHGASDIGAALAHDAQFLQRFHGDPLLACDGVEMEGLGEGAPQMAPHFARDPFALPRRLFRKGDREMLKRPLVAAEARRHDPPYRGHQVGGDLDG
jgi:hypothetical protein